MKSIKLYAKLVQCMAYVLIPVLVLGMYVKWFSDTIPLIDQSSLRVCLGYTFGAMPESTIISGESMPLLSRLLGMAVDSIGLVFLCMALFTIIALMERLKHGETFSSNVAGLFARLSKTMFAWAVCTPFIRMVLSCITTMHNQPGHRMIAISLGTHDLVNILIFGFFMVIAWLVHEGSRLQNEQDLTV